MVDPVTFQLRPAAWIRGPLLRQVQEGVAALQSDKENEANAACGADAHDVPWGFSSQVRSAKISRGFLVSTTRPLAEKLAPQEIRSAYALRATPLTGNMN